ncbi:glycoside hydrolase domain-containing protein [Paenibacillus sp. LHD-38]|uniref:Ig-like domain-containing protein n=1 Tax=Paenibacillus sp. LHD-38 TaxID=3072143 RepID=UPI00280E0038|nr:glycoside hydrolase domain-containing protein [Paenibacillus sp. LHD-38]MDQ8735156.1 DUF6067 family protein [Paenibacillus sp. LHD-38]
MRKKSFLPKLFIWCLLLSLMLPNLAQTEQAKAASNEESMSFIINDFEIGDGINQFKYFGPWGVSTGISGLHNGDEHWSNAANWSDPNDVYFTVKFVGERIMLYGITGPRHGIYAVSVDGGEATEVDAYSANRTFNQVIFDSGALASGEHIVKVKATGKKTGTAPDMQIDYAEVTKQVVHATGIEMDAEPLVIEEGSVVQLRASVLPANATNKSVVWSSSNASIAQIDEQGRLTAENAGNVTVTAASLDGGFRAMREIQIKAGSHFLKGAVGTTDMHYVKANLFDDYKRVDYEELSQLTDKAWKGSAWKGDRASAQLVLWTTSKVQEQVSLTIGSLVDHKNNKIDASHLTAHFVKTTKAARGNPSQGKPQELIPDILDSAEPVSMEKFSVQPIWVSIDVPRDAAAGQYTGQMTVQAASGENVAFTL